jgi:hypothetical protein
LDFENRLTLDFCDQKWGTLEQFELARIRETYDPKPVASDGTRDDPGLFVGWIMVEISLTLVLLARRPCSFVHLSGEHHAQRQEQKTTSEIHW